jgi:hypothetical protein
MLWTGYDGVSWDISGGHGGLCMLPGVRGLSMPAITHYKSRTAAVPGARWRGSSTNEREVFWPIQIYHDTSSTEWIARDRAFWNTMQPHRTGTWTVIQPSGDRRTLTLRFRDDGTQTFQTDPAMVGWCNYGITLDAEQPYWAGTAQGKLWKGTGTAGNFLPGPPFTIASGAAAASAKMTNPGDVEAYPIWTLTGPLTSASIAIDGRTITVPFAVPSGQTLVIDTNPNQLTAIMAGVDKITQLSSADFAPLPVGVDIPIALALAGSGSCEISITPLYYRAW